VLYVQSHKMQHATFNFVRNLVFNNTGPTGGAVSFQYSQNSSQNHFRIEENEFCFNQADLGGGGVNLEFHEPSSYN